MKKISLFLLSLMIFSSIVFFGCSEPSDAERKQFVVVYAKTLQFYESEKIGRRLSDSLYQIQLACFLDSLHTSEAEFKEKVQKVSADVNEWKEFLSEVNRAVDSIRVSRER